MSFLKSTGVLILVLFAFSLGCGGKGKNGPIPIIDAGGETTPEAAPEIVPEVVSGQPGGTSLPPVPSAGAGMAPITGGGGVTPTGGGTTGGTGTGTVPAPTGTTGGTSGGTTGQTPQIQIGTWSPTNTATIDPSRLGEVTTSPTFGTLTPTYEAVNLTPYYLPPPPKDITTDEFFSVVPGVNYFPVPSTSFRPVSDASLAVFRKKEGLACENYIETWVVVEFRNLPDYFQVSPVSPTGEPPIEWFDLQLKSCDVSLSQCRTEIVDIRKELQSVCDSRGDNCFEQLYRCPDSERCELFFHGKRDFACTRGEDVGQAEKYVISVVPNENHPICDPECPLVVPDSLNYYLEVATPANLRP